MREKLNVGGRGDVENALANGAFGLRVLRLAETSSASSTTMFMYSSKP